MKGILLVNMGGPQSLREMRVFLKNMFQDKHILPLPWGLRHFVAHMIAQKRHPESWKKYQLIGGSPIIKHTEAVAEALRKEINEKVYTAYSYTQPYIKEVIKNMVEDGIESISVLTMYPQASNTTTTSVFADVETAIKKYPFLSIHKKCDYSLHPYFLKYWQTLIRKHIEDHAVEDPLLLFTAHSIPEYGVKKGDKYPESIFKMAQKLAEMMGLPHEVAFQSRVGPVKWVGPDTDEYLEALIQKGNERIVMIPLSFTTECLETIYDLNINLVDNYKNDSRVRHLSRVEIPMAHPMFIESLKQIVNE